MKCISKIFIGLTLAIAAAQSQAVPTLQVGAYAGSGDSGTYADYIASSTSPHEHDTAFTGSTSILFAGVFGSNTIKLGSQYIDSIDGTGDREDGDDYGDIDSALTVFNGHGAIVMASVADGADASALTVGGVSSFHTSSILDGLFPNNHDPLKDHISDFLFFDIGDFQNLNDAVVNFDESEPDAGDLKDGEIKELTIAGLTGLEWVHFDLIALETDSQGRSGVRTSWEFNPGSHDVTWKPPTDIPEPTILALLGIGLIGLGLRRSRK